MKATPFLMFQGDAKAALALWCDAFPELEVIAREEYSDGPLTGQIASATIRLGGSEWRLHDSPPIHAFTFTSATSIFVDCDDEAHLRRLAETLGAGGQVMMALDHYGFSRLFIWLADRFGVSWQLNLP